MAVPDFDFKSALSRLALKDDTFTAFAKSFNHTNADEIVAALKRDKTVRGIAMSSDGVRQLHALRIRIFPYPEGVVAVWVMVAVCAQYGFRR